MGVLRTTRATVRGMVSLTRPAASNVASRRGVPDLIATGSRADTRREFGSSAVIRAAAEFSGMSEQGLTESQVDVRRAIQDVCSQFGDDYWMEKDQ